MNPHAPRALVVGSSNTDLVLSCARLPAPGETIGGGEFARWGGGKGANQAVALARAGAQVAFVGARGDDDFGHAAAQALGAEGIDVSRFAVRAGASSGVALIFVGGEGRENLIGVARSANDTLGADDIGAAQDLLAGARIAVAQLEVPLDAIHALAASCERLGVPLLLNPAPAPGGGLPLDLLQRVAVLVPNEGEAQVLAGEPDPERAAEVLLARGCGAVAVTLGAEGVLLADASGTRRIAAPRVEPVDTVGAGDCFCGWLAAGLAEGKSLDEAAGRAVRAAALCVSRPGAQNAMPRRDEVEAAAQRGHGSGRKRHG